MDGEEFKKLRIKKGFKYRSDLAEELGCRKNSVRRWETGRRKVNQMAVNFLNSLKDKEGPGI